MVKSGVGWKEMATIDSTSVYLIAVTPQYGEMVIDRFEAEQAFSLVSLSSHFLDYAQNKYQAILCVPGNSPTSM